MAYKRATLRGMPPETRELARLSNDLESVNRRLRNRLHKVQDNETWVRADIKAQRVRDDVQAEPSKAGWLELVHDTANATDMLRANFLALGADRPKLEENLEGKFIQAYELLSQTVKRFMELDVLVGYLRLARDLRLEEDPELLEASSA